MSRSELPAALAALAEWLDERGFEQTIDRASKSFGDLLLGWTKPTAWVRLMRDRDEWSMDVSRPGLDAWFSLQSWYRFLGGKLPIRTMLSEEQIAGIAKSVIPRVESLDTPNDVLRDHLMQLRRAVRD